MAMPNETDVQKLGWALGPGGDAAARRIIDSAANTNVGIGSSPVSTIVATEYQSNLRNQTVLTITNLSVTMTDTGGANGGYGSQKIYDLPAGLVGAVVRTNLTLTAAAGISATATVKHAVGSVAVSTSDTLNSTLANFIASTNTVLVASAGTAKGVSTAETILDGTSAAVDLILNFGVADAGISASSSLTVSGTITITWQNYGTL